MSIAQTKVILTATDIEINIGERKILDKISFSIHAGEKIGLLGRNGSGKTSLIRLIMEIEKPDGGKVEKRKDLTIGYLSQNPELILELTVYENLLKGAGALIHLLEEYEQTEDHNRKEELFDEINALDGWNLENRINALINNMNLPPRDKLVEALSGGEKRRLAIAKAIVGNPDLLILDEPTNHLDTESIEWLQQFLKKFRGACLFVTHDRYFLDEIATRIVELSGGKLHSHSGNYTEYLLKKAERESSMESDEHNRERFLKKELAWMARSPQGRTTKSKGRIQRYQDAAGKEKGFKDLDVEMIIPTPPGLSDRVLDIKNLSYELNGKTLFKDINIEFQKGMRVGIVGRNGSGKSTFLQVLLGHREPTTGRVIIASRTEINYSDQNKLLLNPENSVITEIGENSDLIHIAGKAISVRAYLKRFLFDELQLKSLIKNLSGGEKSRLILAKILKSGGNFLILDEPTNDLDLPTLRVLEEALIEFDGCVLVVSHDRYFLNRIATHILGFEENGKTRFTAGDYNFYRRLQSEYSINSPQDKSIKQSLIKPDYHKKKEIDKIERQIAKAEENIKVRTEKFLEPDFYIKEGDKIQRLTEELDSAKKELEKLYKEWEGLIQ
jgi:ATP-binding cassette subfamily F protein uup